MNVLCENIRTYRKKLGMTQKELAERLDISDKTVSRWESGVQLPEASLIPMIAEALSTSIDALYGIENSTDSINEGSYKPLKDENKILLDFKIWMTVGIVTSLLGSLLYRWFGSTVFLSPRIIDVEYYNTAKGAAADIFAFIGMIAIFAGITAIIITKVRFSMLHKPYMDNTAFATNARYTGAAAVIYSLILIKTASEILSFGLYVPREVYGYIFVSALTAVLFLYIRQLSSRRIAYSKPMTVLAPIIGAVGIILSVTSRLLRDHAALSGVTETGSQNTLMLIATVMLSAAELMILAMPALLYAQLLIKLRRL